MAGPAFQLNSLLHILQGVIIKWDITLYLAITQKSSLWAIVYAWFPKYCSCNVFYWWTELCFCLYCRTVSVQKSSNVIGLLLLGVCGRLTLSRIHSRLCSGGFLHGLRVNIHYQLCVALHKPDTKESNWRNEGKSWIESVTCKIQHFFFWTGSEKQIHSHSIYALFTPVMTFQRNRTHDASQKIYKMIFRTEIW